MGPPSATRVFDAENEAVATGGALSAFEQPANPGSAAAQTRRTHANDLLSFTTVEWYRIAACSSIC